MPPPRLHSVSGKSASQGRLFSVDLTQMGGYVLKAEQEQKKIADSDQKIVVIPNADRLLFQKCETFLGRRVVKSRDAFDIEVLLSKGAKLSGKLKAHLHDFIEMRELDSESIRNRISRVDAKLCTAELRPVLPDALFTALAQQQFKPLQSSLEIVFCDWL